jgi:hypothetical protein
MPPRITLAASSIGDTAAYYCFSSSTFSVATAVEIFADSHRRFCVLQIKLECVISWESDMKVFTRAVFVLLSIFFAMGAALAQDGAGNRDPAAVEVLQRMDAYMASMQRFEVTAESYNDATLDDLTIFSNPSVSVLTIDRPNSLRSASHDGLHTSEIYLDKGVLTVFSNKHNYYARAKVPEDLEEALLFALEEFEVETPLLDFLILNSLEHLMSDDESIIYLTDKSPIRGVDCHHIVVSGPHADLQVWVEEGDHPLPRRSVMTLKTAHGLPRHEIFMDWNEEIYPDPSIFEFEPPDGAIEIRFINLP